MVVPEKFVNFAMIPIGATLGNDVDSPNPIAELGVHGAAFDAYFLNTCRRLELRYIALQPALHVGAVHGNVRRAVAVATHKDSGRGKVPRAASPSGPHGVK